MAGWGSSQLQNLDLLYLHYNQLTALPPALGQLQKLTNLDLDENPWTGCLPGAWRNKHIDFIVSEHPSFCTD